MDTDRLGYASESLLSCLAEKKMHEKICSAGSISDLRRIRTCCSICSQIKNIISKAMDLTSGLG